jgi:hypothetical protein
VTLYAGKYADKYADKYAFMDFHANIKNERSVIIEMQANGHVMFDELSMFYASYTFSINLWMKFFVVND